MTPQQREAIRRMDEFVKFRVGPGKWPLLDRAIVAEGIKDRILDPGRIDQHRAGLCGPAAFPFHIAQREPVQYAQYAIDLFDQGSAHVGKMEVRPSELQHSRQQHTVR